MNPKKLLRKLAGGAHHNVAFRDMVALAEAHGFRLARVRGSHYIFAHPDVPDVLNLQEFGGEAKAYQTKQFMRLVEMYDLRMEREP